MFSNIEISIPTSQSSVKTQAKKGTGGNKRKLSLITFSKYVILFKSSLVKGLSDSPFLKYHIRFNRFIDKILLIIPKTSSISL